MSFYYFRDSAKSYIITFDFTYLTIFFFKIEPYIKDLFCSIVLSETRDYVIRLSETKLEKKNMKLNNIRMFYNISGVK